MIAFASLMIFNILLGLRLCDLQQHQQTHHLENWKLLYSAITLAITVILKILFWCVWMFPTIYIFAEFTNIQFGGI